MKTETIIKILIGAMGCALVYAADWQREQDQRLSAVDVLLARQQEIIRMQVQLNEMEMRLKAKAKQPPARPVNRKPGR